MTWWDRGYELEPWELWMRGITLLAAIGAAAWLGVYSYTRKDEPNITTYQSQIQRSISQPGRCKEIINGGFDRADRYQTEVQYLFCENTDGGRSLFLMPIDGRHDWTETVYK